MVIFPIAYLAKWGWHLKREIVIKSIIFAGAVFVPIVPVILTNIIKGGEFVLISTQGGANFYIGNSKGADGITVVALGPQLRMGKYNDNVWTSSIDEAERATGRKMSQSEVSSYWYNKTLKEIKLNLGHSVLLYLKKFYYFWHGQEIINIKSLYSAGEYSLLMKALLWRKIINFPSGILFPLMIMGIFFAFRNKEDVLVPASFIIFLGLLISIFFICARFRQPVIPVAIIFATYAAHLFKKHFSHKPKYFAGTGMVLLILIIGLNWGGNLDSKENLSQFEAITGEAYMNKNDYSKAIEHLEKSLEILPDNLGIFDMLGRSYLESGLVEKAQAIYQRGIELFPAYPLFNFGLGRIAQMNNDFPASKEFYNRVIKYSPDYAPAYELLADIYKQEQNLDSALYFYRKLDSLGIPDPGASQLIKTRIQTLEKMLGEKH